MPAVELLSADLAHQRLIPLAVAQQLAINCAGRHA
jgi:hypothetical protein